MGVRRGPQTGERSGWEGGSASHGASPVQTPGGPPMELWVGSFQRLVLAVLPGVTWSCAWRAQEPAVQGTSAGQQLAPWSAACAPGIADVRYGSLDTGLAPALGGCAHPPHGYCQLGLVSHTPALAPRELGEGTRPALALHPLQGEGGPGPGAFSALLRLGVRAGSLGVLSLAPVGGCET